MKNNKLLKTGVFITVIIITLTVVAINVTSKNSIPRNIELGNRYLLEGKYEEAVLVFEKVIRIDNKNIPAMIGLSEAYIALEEYEKARKTLKEILLIDDRITSAYQMLSDISLKENDTQTASEILKEGYEKTNDPGIYAKMNEISALFENNEKDIDDTVDIKDSDQQNVTSTEPDTDIIHINSLGNTNGNSINQGKAVKQGDDIFFANYPSIYKMSEKTGEIITLYDNVDAWSLCAIGDHLYFIGSFWSVGSSFDGFKYGIYKTGINGDEVSYIYDFDGICEADMIAVNALQMNIKDDWIYFTCIDDDSLYHNFYRVRIDGSNLELIDQKSTNFNFYGDYIYYTKKDFDNNNYGIYRCKPDGSEKTMLLDKFSPFYMIINEGHAYFEEMNLHTKRPEFRRENNSIVGGFCRYDINSDEITLLIDEGSFGAFNIENDIIYLGYATTNFSGDQLLHLVDNDGKNKTVLSEGKPTWIATAGIWLFFTEINEEGTIYNRLNISDYLH